MSEIRFISPGTSSGSGMAIGDAVTGGTDNSVLFIDPAGILAEDPTKFNYDKANVRFGIGGTSTASKLFVKGAGSDNIFLFENSGGGINFRMNNSGECIFANLANVFGSNTIDTTSQVLIQSANTNGLRIRRFGGSSEIIFNTIESGIYFPQLVQPSANFGVVNFGAGAFDGVTAGFFSGNANGTQMAMNAPTGYVGDLCLFAIGGVEMFRIISTGALNVGTGGTNKVTLNPVNTSILFGGNTVMRGVGNTLDFGNFGACTGSRFYTGGSIRVEVRAAGVFTTVAAQFFNSTVAQTDYAGAFAGTLLNAPAAGNPTKWLRFDDAGVMRYIPAW